MTLDEIQRALNGLEPELERCRRQGILPPVDLLARLDHIWLELKNSASTRERNDSLRFVELLIMAEELRAMLQDDPPCREEAGESGDAGGDPWAEIRRLHRLLEEAGIPHRFVPHFLGAGFQVLYFGRKGPPEVKPGHQPGPAFGAVCSAIQTPFSEGHERGLIEVLEQGAVDARSVFESIRRHWEEEEEEEGEKNG